MWATFTEVEGRQVVIIHAVTWQIETNTYFPY